MFHLRRLLLVEDDGQEIEHISGLLRHLAAEFVVVSRVNDAISLLASQAFDYLLCDLHIETRAGKDRPDGLRVIEAAAELHPGITIVAHSSDPRSEIWQEALASGAHHFLRKPFSKSDELVIGFGLARERRILLNEAQRTKKTQPMGRWRSYAEQYPYGIVIGEKELKRTRGVARTRDASFVITGETGTGKEEIAKLIHRFRIEKEGPIPFVAVNCASLSGSLADSLLFGHRKGAFTGAEQTTNGYIGEADGGILFLDEIHALDPPTQQKFLRVLNDGSYHRVGETKTYRSHFQLIAASTKDLDLEVDAGRFLLDIRMRMSGLDMYIRPLRERTEDIPALVSLFLARRNVDLSDEQFERLVQLLKSQPWKGNIRQLFKALEAWLLLAEFDELPLEVETFPLPKDRGTRNASSHEESSWERALREDMTLEAALSGFEKVVLTEALKRHRVVAECCEILGLSRSTLDAKRRKYGLMIQN